MYSNSRGSLKIKSKDPFEKPSIVFNYLSTKEDEQEWVEAIRVARNILSQKRWIHLMVVKFLRDHLYKQMKKYWTGCAKMVKQHYTHHAVQNGAGNRSNGSCRSTNNESPWHGEFARRGCFSNAKNYKWKHSRTGTYACRKSSRYHSRQKPLEPQYVDYYIHGKHDPNDGAMEHNPYYPY